MDIIFLTELLMENLLNRHSYISHIIHSLLQADADRRLFTFLSARGEDRSITAKRFLADIGFYAERFDECGIAVGDVLPLAFGHEYELVAAFFGALYRGAIPTIVPYVSSGIGERQSSTVLRHLATSSHLRAIVTPESCEMSVREIVGQSNCTIITVPPLSDMNEESFGETSSWHGDTVASDPLFLQFTSGTTGTPRGITISDGALLNYLRVTADMLAFTADDVIVSWLPLFHDMGLVTGVLHALFAEHHSVLINPAEWLRQPVLLFEALTRFRGTMCWMPNFAFRYCVRALGTRKLSGLDLSSVRIMGCGSEMVDYEALETFSRTFQQYGLQREAITVGYGLAEHIAGVTLTPHDRFPDVDWVRSDSLESSRAEPVSSGSAGSRPIVSCGYPKASVEIRVIDDEQKSVPDRDVGHVLIKSPSLFSGYFRQPEETDRSLRDGWLTTGDLGYMVEGQLYICGRHKDLIIVAGRNIHPVSLERIAEQVMGNACRYAVAIGVNHPSMGTESAVIIVELREAHNAPDLDEYRRNISTAIHDEMLLYPGDIVFVDKGWIPKSTSGKIKRSTVARLYREHFQSPADALWCTTEEARASDGGGSCLTPTQQWLLDCWRSLFSGMTITIDDNFFELGGDSILAAELVVRIEEAFQRRLPAVLLLKSPTIADLAAIIDQPDIEPEWHALVAIQAYEESSSCPPFFCVHGLTGGVLRYRSLSQALGKSCPFYAVQSPPHDEECAPLTIESMAASYIREIRSTPFNGPWFLGGYCFGGVVAWEMARQLSAMGEQVALVAVFEGVVTADDSPPGSTNINRSLRYLYHFVRGLPWWVIDHFSLQGPSRHARVRHVVNQIQRRLHHTFRGDVPFEEPVSALPPESQRVFNRNLEALRHYNAAAYDGPVVLFRSRQTLAYAPEDDRGWGRLTGSPVRVEFISGTHHTILNEPHVSMLADKLRRFLGYR